MADQRIQATELMVGSGHANLADTLNRLVLVEHNNDGTHKSLSDSIMVHKDGSSQFSVPDATWTLITFDTEEFDTNGNFADNAFTPTTAGKYLLSATVGMPSQQDGKKGIVAIYKNGVMYKQGAHSMASANTSIAANISIVVDANGVDDDFTVYFWHNAIAASTVNGDEDITHFSACRIG